MATWRWMRWSTGWLTGTISSSTTSYREVSDYVKINTIGHTHKLTNLTQKHPYFNSHQPHTLNQLIHNHSTHTIITGQLSDYIYIKMDEIKDGKVVHSTLNNIQAVGNPRLGVGRVNNAVNLDGNGQYLDVGKHREICLGNLVYCQDGFNNAMWVKFISMPDYSYLYSNGKGIEVSSIGLKYLL